LALLHQLGSVAGPAWLPVPLTPALLPTLIYVVTYVAMDPVAGGAAAALMLALHGWTAGLMAAAQPVFDLPLWQAVLAFHVTMWVVQFIGHGVFEGRAPALLDSLDQALVTAPLFVVLEIFFFFGYRKVFYQECMVEVKKEIEKFNYAKNK